MSLELPGIRVIEHPHEARASARRWRRMAAEVDTPDAPPDAKSKASELRQRAAAAEAWARKEEDARTAADRAHDAHLEHHNVTPIRKGGTAEQQHGPLRKTERGVASSTLASAGGADEGFVRGQAREVGRRTYHAARPRALRLGNHFYQGLAQPFGPAGEGGDLVMYALGLTLAVVLVTNLVKAPGAISEVVDHGTGALHRVVGLTDPITGTSAVAPAPAARRPAAATTARHPGAN